MNGQRRRIIKKTPMFAIGRNPKQVKSKPGSKPKFCRANKNTQQNSHTSIFECMNNLPIQILFEFTSSSRSFTARYKRMKELEEIHSLYDKANVLYIGPSYRQLHYDLDCQQYWLKMEQKCIAAFRRLVGIWLYKRYKARLLNTEDPATCEIPVKPIHVYDTKAKGTYVFEALTLKKRIESSLSYSEWIVPYPAKPNNPLTNVKFTDAQLLKILMELRKHGYGSWIFESYKRLAFNIVSFHDIFTVPIKLRALYDILRDPNHEDMIDLLSEFIEDEFDFHELATQSYRSLLPWAVKHIPHHPYIQSWRKLFSMYMSNMIIYGTNDHKLHALLDTIHDESHTLFSNKKEIKSIVQIRMQQQRELQTRVVTLYPSVSFIIS